MPTSASQRLVFTQGLLRAKEVHEKNDQIQQK
jgi:hypothetical protein